MLRNTLILIGTLCVSQLVAQPSAHDAWQKYTEIKKAQCSQESLQKIKVNLKQKTSIPANEDQDTLLNKCLQHDCSACKDLKEIIEKSKGEVDKLIHDAAINGQKLLIILQDTALSNELRQELAAPLKKAALEFLKLIKLHIPACSTYAYVAALTPMESIEINSSEFLVDKEPLPNKIFCALIPEDEISVPAQEQLAHTKKIKFLSDQAINQLPTALQNKNWSNTNWELYGVVAHKINPHSVAKTTDLREVLVFTGREKYILQQLYKEYQQKIVAKLDSIIDHLGY